VSVRAEPRLTRDVDVAVSVSDDTGAEALIRSLSDLGHRVVFLLEQEETGILGRGAGRGRDLGSALYDLRHRRGEWS
jgi:hypothetical protein